MCLHATGTPKCGFPGPLSLVFYPTMQPSGESLPNLNSQVALKLKSEVIQLLTLQARTCAHPSGSPRARGGRVL